MYWIFNATSGGGPITWFWEQRYDRFRCKDGEDVLATVEENLQDGIGALWEEMEERVVKKRGGLAPALPAQTDRSLASYLWKLFRQQGYMLKKANMLVLNDETILPQLTELLEEAKAEVPLGTGARRVAEAMRASEAGEGEMAPNEAEAEGESGSEDEMDLPTGE